MKIKTGIEKTLSNSLVGNYGLYLIPTIEVSTDRNGNGRKPNKIDAVAISISWLTIDLYLTIFF